MRKSEKFDQKLRCYAEDNMNLTTSSNRQGGYTQQPLHCDKKKLHITSLGMHSAQVLNHIVATYILILTSAILTTLSTFNYPHRQLSNQGCIFFNFKLFKNNNP